MSWFDKLFRRKNIPPEREDDWEEVVFSHDGVDMRNEEQRTRYVTECLEQIAEAAKEVEQLKGEYARVTDHLTDIEEIEALPAQDREELNEIARKVLALEQERKRLMSKKERLTDNEYYQLRKQEAEVEEGIEKLTKAEEYDALVRQDLKRLHRERTAYEIRCQELKQLQGNLRGMAIIFLTALIACAALLLILQFGFEMNVAVGYFLAVMSAAIAITVLCIKYLDADRESAKAAAAIRKLIGLQNKVKIRYANNRNLLNYLYMKYDTDSASRLKKLWAVYQREKEERRQFAEAEADLEHYQRALVSNMKNYRVKDAERWQNQTAALLDEREMVELRHGYILRRQALRKQLDYNTEIAENARKEIMTIVQEHPEYTGEILEMVEHYEHIS